MANQNKPDIEVEVKEKKECCSSDKSCNKDGKKACCCCGFFSKICKFFCRKK